MWDNQRFDRLYGFGAIILPSFGLQVGFRNFGFRAWGLSFENKRLSGFGFRAAEGKTGMFRLGGFLSREL